MTDMKHIASNIKPVKSIKKLRNVLGVVSTVVSEKIQRKTEYYRDSMNVLLSIVQAVQSKVSLFDYGVIQTPIKKHCIVVTSTENVRHLYDEYYYQKDQVDVFCIGKQTVEFFVNAGFCVVGFLELKDLFEDEDLNDLYVFLKDAIARGLYGDIKMYVDYFKDAIKHPLVILLFPLQQDDFNVFLKDLDVGYSSVDSSFPAFLVEPSIDNIRKELVEQLLQYIVYGALLQNKSGEYAARMFAMKNVERSCYDIVENQTLKYHKARQTIERV